MLKNNTDIFFALVQIIALSSVKNMLMIMNISLKKNY